MSTASGKRQHPYKQMQTRREDIGIMLARHKLRLYYYRGARRWEIWRKDAQIARDNISSGNTRLFAGTYSDCYNWIVHWILYGAAPGSPIPACPVEFTCSNCLAKFDCTYAFDPYCTDGDCLAEK